MVWKKWLKTSALLSNALPNRMIRIFMIYLSNYFRVRYDVVPDSTIRMTNGTAQGADGKKWDVEGGAYVRGVAANIKVDYGKSGIAPPSSKIGVSHISSFIW